MAGHKKKTAIVGGGPSSLMTAYLLEQAGIDNITIFEGSHRIGGKVKTSFFPSYGAKYEAGTAELYDIPGDELRSFLEDDIGLATRNMSGKAVVMDGVVIKNRQDFKRHFGAKSYQALEKFRKRLKRLRPVHKYSDAGNVKDNHHPLSKVDFEKELEKIKDEKVIEYLKVAMHCDLATHPCYTNSVYGYDNLLTDSPVIDDEYCNLFTIEGGIEHMIIGIANKLSCEIMVDAQVSEVISTSEGYMLVYDSGEVVDCPFHKIIFALPHNWLSQIHFRDLVCRKAFNEHTRYYNYPAHYLRVTLLFSSQFYREKIQGDYWQFDAFGGVCMYDDSKRYDNGDYGVLSCLIAGDEALNYSNYKDGEIVNKVVEKLSDFLPKAPSRLLEAKVDRWAGTVSAQPGGMPIKSLMDRHVPDKKNKNLMVCGDYLFDSTINGSYYSATIVRDILTGNFAED